VKGGVAVLDINVTVGFAGGLLLVVVFVAGWFRMYA